MPRVFILCLFLSFTSCALFDGYETNRHRWYHLSLTDAEINAVDQQGYIYKSWHGTNKNGDFAKGKLLMFRKDKKHFYFMENGNWLERHTVSMPDGKHHMEDAIEYDEFGNILNQWTYIRPVMDSISGWKLYYQIESTVTDSLRQKVTYFYKNGKPEHIEYWTDGLYRPEKDDYLQYDYMTRYEGYDTTGQLTETSTTHRKVYIWSEPRLRMKKER